MQIGRRSWIGTALASAGGSILSAAQPAPEGVIASSSAAVTETTSGKVRGCVRRGIVIFKGIPYAAPAAGARRFMPPAKPQPWAGIRSSLSYGFVSPQQRRAEWGQDEMAWVFDWDDGVQAEDCLRVNVWTPGLRDNGKRPVLVWLHGGGFSAGSGHELKSYDGENLARRGGVVVVSLNHRLGPVGFLNLASIGGERYSASGNAGMLDLVAALEWVRDNIGAFGGDPGNVTIFGQSGGGGKVNALMTMPRARGLFHKAIVHSGSLTRMPLPENSAKLAAAVLSALDVSPANLARLHEVPFDRLVSAGAAAAKKLFPPVDFSRPVDFRRHGELFAWAPTVDGNVLPAHPFDESAPAVSAQVPLIVGSTLNEFAVGFDNPAFDALTDRQLLGRVVAGHGKEKAIAIVEALRRGHPGAKPSDLFTIWFSSGVRRAAVDQAALKAAQGGASAYLYWFAWHTPVLDGRLRAFHCLDLAFAFDNTDRCETMTGGGPRPRALAAQMSEAWIRFARTGNPNHAGLPEWPAFRQDTRATMIFDDVSAAKTDPDGDELRALA